MQNKLDFLRKYKRNVRIIPFDQTNKFDPEWMPSAWYDLFNETDVTTRIETILSMWKEHMGTELSNTISYLSEHLKEIDLMEIDGRYSILYTIKTGSKEIYYEGRSPKDAFNNEVLEESWDKIPPSIRKFYENVHNGFYYYASESMGLVPLEAVTFFDDDEWGIIEELEEPLQIDLKTTFGFFKSGMGGYVAVDYSNFDNDLATLWWTNKQPRYKINFWDVVDEWIVIGFEV